MGPKLAALTAATIVVSCMAAPSAFAHRQRLGVRCGDNRTGSKASRIRKKTRGALIPG